MDLTILQWINQHWHSVAWINQMFKYITYLGEYGAVWIALGVVLCIFRKTRRIGVAVLLSLLADFLVTNLIVKPLVARTRPFVLDEDIALFLEELNVYLPTDASFPSGHTASAFAAAFPIFLWHKKAGAAAMALAFVIAFSRVFLCVHFLTDVLAGMAFGIFFGGAVYLILRKTGFLKKPA